MVQVRCSSEQCIPPSMKSQSLVGVLPGQWQQVTETSKNYLTNPLEVDQAFGMLYCMPYAIYKVCVH